MSMTILFPWEGALHVGIDKNHFANISASKRKVTKQNKISNILIQIGI